MKKPKNATDYWKDGNYLESFGEEIKILFKDDGLFHIGQCYEDEVAKTFYCEKCQGNEFHVGQGNFYTAIKCKTCGWEGCIHEG